MTKKTTVDRLKKAKRIREAGKQTEQEFFGKGGPLEVKGNPVYPFYLVEGYQVPTFEEALQLAEVMSEKDGRAIHVMEKLDSHTPFHSLKVVQIKDNPITVVGLANPVDRFSDINKQGFMKSVYKKPAKPKKAKPKIVSCEQCGNWHLEGRHFPIQENPITVVGLANPGKKKHRSSLVVPQQIDQKTFNHWVKTGALKVTSRGDENTYGVTEFGHEYYVKDYGENPPRSVHANIEGIIYNRCIEIRAEKTGYKKGFYKHPFSRGSQVCIYALDNGDLLVHSKAGVKLWQPD